MRRLLLSLSLLAIVGGLAVGGVGAWLYARTVDESRTASFDLVQKRPGELSEAPEDAPKVDPALPARLEEAIETQGAADEGEPAEEPEPDEDVYATTAFQVPLTVRLPDEWEVTADEYEQLVIAPADSTDDKLAGARIRITYVGDTGTDEDLTAERTIDDASGDADDVLDPLHDPVAAVLFEGEGASLTLGAPDDTSIASGPLAGASFTAGDRVQLVAGTTGTAMLLVQAQAQATRWGVAWPAMRDAIASLAPPAG